MKRHWKLAGLALAAMAAVAVLGLAGGDQGREGDTFVDDSGFLPQDDVSTAIDRALGREQAVTAKQGSTGEGAASRSSSAGLAPPADAASAASKVPAVAGGAPDSTLASVSDRRIVQTASIKMQVKDVGGGFEEVGRIATAAGGFVASSNFAFQGEDQVASVTIRVPADRYQQALSQVRALGAKVDNEASNASDVTEEYSDLSARLRTLEATEAQLLLFLGQAKNITEVLQVQDRLNSVRSEIERVKGRMSLLDKLSDLATISVQLRPLAVPVKAGGGVDLGAEVSRAWEDSLEFLGGITAGVLTVLVFSWWLVPLAVPAAIAWRRFATPRPSAPAAASE